MLLEFTIANYRSFKEPVTFSMLGSSLKELSDSNVFVEHKYKLLKSAIIYGANASGKSNFFKAIAFVKAFILNSAKEFQAAEAISVESFKLSTQTYEMPSTFEIIFLIEKIRYRYGFQVTRTAVTAEWLFYASTTKEGKLFTREGDKITLGLGFREGKGLEAKTRSNALFLSVVAQFNGKISTDIIKWFKKINIIAGIEDTFSQIFTIQKLQDDPSFKDFVLEYLKVADIDISDFAVKIADTRFNGNHLSGEVKNIFVKPTDANAEIFEYQLNLFHPKLDDKNNIIALESFDFEMESAGTQKLFSLAGPIWDTMKNGKILFIDEFEARLHQKLIEALLKLFNSRTVNIHKAQFILASHNTSALRSDFFRRDQIWFISKNRYGASELYSLAEYKMDRKIERTDASYAKNYLAGRYGAVPIIYDFESIYKSGD